MLFSPPNEFGKQAFYKLLGYSFAVHSLLLVLVCGTEVWFSMRPTVVSLRKPGRVSMPGSRRGKRGSAPKNLAQGQASQSSSLQPGDSQASVVEDPPRSSPASAQATSPAEEPKKVAEKAVPEKTEKKQPEKVNSEKSLPEKKEKKAIPPAPAKASAKNAPVKPVPEKKAPEAKKENPHTEEKKSVQEAKPQGTVKQESAKKDLDKKSLQQELQAAAKTASKDVRSERNGVPQAATQKNPSLTAQVMSTSESSPSSAGEDDGDGYGDGEEVSAADAALSEDVIQQEFGRNFTIPEGFEEYDSFTISFDIKDGKVVNVSPHSKGALVVYTAVKDALLKSKMPMRTRKNIVWVIT